MLKMVEFDEAAVRRAKGLPQVLPVVALLEEDAAGH
jgi:hypothetical protein